MKRSAPVRACALAAALAAAAAVARGAATEGFHFDAFVPLDRETEAAIERAQKWLADQQRPDGSWNTAFGRNNVGEISYALLALMSTGSVPGEGPFGEEIGRGIQFLLNSQRETGLIVGANDSRGPMYQHALGTLALVEAYGMTGNPRIRGAIIKAVDLIGSTQHSGGGWRYDPQIQPGDISITVMQVMALRAAVEAGIYVPDETIERALRFVKGCWNAKEKGFTYQPHGGEAAFPRTGAGVVSLQTVGLHNDPCIPDAVQYLLDHGFGGEKGHFWYGHYYSAVAIYHYGGDAWKTYYPRARQMILNGWGGKGRYRGLLDTSWQVLVLAVPYRYLPIYQR